MRELAPRVFWLIAKLEAGRINMLTTNLTSSEEALPVFSFEEEAAMFLRLETLEAGGWRVWQISTGDLVSVLLGLCAGVDRVLLDPLPGPDAEVLADLVGIEREAFMELQLCKPTGLRSPKRPAPRVYSLPAWARGYDDSRFGGDLALRRFNFPGATRSTAVMTKVIYLEWGLR
jgi:hypothetical protein